MFMRRLPLFCVIASCLVIAVSQARAQDFPTRPITVVVPFPAGSVTDAVTRALGQKMQESLGQPVIIENRAGAQGTLAAAAVAQSKPDGYTLLAGSSVMFVAGSLYKKLSYDPVTSFQPVSGVGSTSMIFMVAEASPIRNVDDLAQAVKAQGTPLTIGFGSPSGQIALALLSNITKSTPVPVSYRGIPQTLTDLAGGHVQVAIVDLGSGIAQISATKMRPLAISAMQRYAGLPAVPTLAESFPGAGAALETIIAMLAPAGTPAPVVDKLDNAIRTALKDPDLQGKLRFLHTSVLPLSAEQLVARIKNDNPVWQELISKAGIEQQ